MVLPSYPRLSPFIPSAPIVAAIVEAMPDIIPAFVDAIVDAIVETVPDITANAHKCLLGRRGGPFWGLTCIFE